MNYSCLHSVPVLFHIRSTSPKFYPHHHSHKYFPVPFSQSTLSYRWNGRHMGLLTVRYSQRAEKIKAKSRNRVGVWSFPLGVVELDCTVLYSVWFIVLCSIFWKTVNNVCAASSSMPQTRDPQLKPGRNTPHFFTDFRFRAWTVAPRGGK